MDAARGLAVFTAGVGAKFGICTLPVLGCGSPVNIARCFVLTVKASISRI
jgi:hypothetical protein